MNIEAKIYQRVMSRAWCYRKHKLIPSSAYEALSECGKFVLSHSSNPAKTIAELHELNQSVSYSLVYHTLTKITLVALIAAGVYLF